MKRTINKIGITLESETSVMFINDMAAIMACNMIAFYYASEGFLTATQMYKGNGSYEVCVHFDFKHAPTLPKGFVYSSYDITSHEYYSDGEQHRVRCKTYYFKVKRCIRERD